MKRLFLVAVLGIMAVIPGYAINDDAGVSGASFLLIGVGARPQGMGGAYCGLADGVDSIWWNPAGLGKIKKKEVMFIHNEWLAEVNYEYLAGALPISDNQGIGVSLSLINPGKIKKTTISYPAGDGSEFDNSNYALNISYGRMIREDLSCGFNLKYISSKIDKFTATGFGADLAGFYMPIENLSIGIVVCNLGTKMKFVKEEDGLPLNIKLGAGYRIEKLNLAMDINKPNDNDLNIGLGAEYWVIKNTALRIGYASGIDEGLGITGGLGVKFGNFRVDYAYTPYSDLGDNHCISLVAGFERERIEMPKKEKRVKEKTEEKKPEKPIEKKPEEPISPTPVKPKPEEFKKPAYLAKLLLSSSPQGAKVYLNGVFKGITPCIIYDLIPEKPYKLRLTIDGYQDLEKEVSFTEESSFLKLQLSP